MQKKFYLKFTNKLLNIFLLFYKFKNKPKTFYEKKQLLNVAQTITYKKFVLVNFKKFNQLK